MTDWLEELCGRYPALAECRAPVGRAAEWICAAYERGGKLLLCGNGGSCADAEHIAGELMKGFLKKRPLSEEQRAQMRAFCPELDEDILDRLQQGLPAVVLSGHPALNTAFANDVDPTLIYAQQVMTLAKPEDVLLAISTSGNAGNVLAAVHTARALGVKAIGLTGQAGGRLRPAADLCICAPAQETYRVQEYHLPIYHALCALVEQRFFTV